MKRLTASLMSSTLALALTAGSVVAAQAAPAMPGRIVVAQNYDRDHRNDRGRDNDHRDHARWHKGDHYRGRGVVVSNWGRYHLRRPPRGYHWVNEDGNFILVAIGTGIIADLILNGR
jgi:Ni/Co efflux regulator RcnB